MKLSIVHTGEARKKRNGEWWFCTRRKGKAGYQYRWPIGNSSQCRHNGQVVDVVKRGHQHYAMVIVQLELFS
jgi:hypothetical protein